MIEESSVDIGAVILAAGASSRMGSPKQTLRFRGESLLRRTALVALSAGCRPVLVVIGANAESSKRELAGLDVVDVLNSDWESGMASSIRAGLESLTRPPIKVNAVIFLLCDQPYVTAEIVSQLADGFRKSRKLVVASTYGDSYGVPALFSRTLFDELAVLKGTAGAKQMIRRHLSETHFVPFPAGDIDVDTPDDFLRLIAMDPDKDLS